MEDSRVLSDPEPYVKLVAIHDSGLEFSSRGWVNSDDYWDVFWDMNEKVVKALREAKIEIPYKTLDVNIKKDNKEDSENA